VGFGGNARKEKRGDITTASEGRKEETTQHGRKHTRARNSNSNKRQGSKPEGTQPKQNRRKEHIKQTTDQREMAMSSRK
jgi:hypothetical protein